MLLGIAAELLILLVLIVVPPLARAFGLAPLSVTEWGFLVPFPLVMVLLEEVRKWLVRIRAEPS